MAYLGDPRETRIQENGSILDGCGHKDDYYKWNGAYYHYCGLPVDDYSTNIYHTKAVDGGGGISVKKGVALVTRAEAMQSGTTIQMAKYTSDVTIKVTGLSGGRDTLVFNIPDICNFNVEIGGQEASYTKRCSTTEEGITFNQYYLDAQLVEGEEFEITFNII